VSGFFDVHDERPCPNTALGVHKALPHVGAGEVRPHESVRDFRVEEGYNTAGEWGMPTSDALTTSRRLLEDSRGLIAEAREVLEAARQTLARQCYRRLVCAWCQQTIRFERCTAAERGQVRHSICYDCFAPVFQELTPHTIPRPVPTLLQ